MTSAQDPGVRPAGEHPEGEPSVRRRLIRRRGFRRAREGGRGKSPTSGQLFFCITSTFCFLLILRNSDAAIEYMGRGLTLCARTVIPSLFPFMVLSELLVASGAGEAFGRIFSRLMRAVFGLSGAGSSAVVLGSLCGFPVGARTAVSLYDRGVISRAECEHLLTFSNNPSSAFLITAVGTSLFGSRRLGVVLYAVVLVSSLLVGFFARFFFSERRRPEAHPHFPSGLHPGGVETFTGAVSSAASGMLTVCAYVIFFSTLTGTLACLSRAVGGMPPTLYALLSGALEMSGGVCEASALPAPVSLILSAGIAGWSGLSVHCQVMTLAAGRGLSFKPYLIAKAAQGLLAAGLMALLLLAAPPGALSPAADRVVTALLDLGGVWKSSSPTLPATLTDGGFILGWILLVLKRGREKRVGADS